MQRQVRAVPSHEHERRRVVIKRSLVCTLSGFRIYLRANYLFLFKQRRVRAASSREHEQRRVVIKRSLVCTLSGFRIYCVLTIYSYLSSIEFKQHRVRAAPSREHEEPSLYSVRLPHLLAC